jgi:hypothetical protein
MILELMLIKRLEVTLHHTPPAVTSLLSGMKTTLCQVLISQFQETSMTFRETVLSLKLDQEMTLTMTSELMLIKKQEGMPLHIQLPVISHLSGMRTTSCQVPILPFQEMNITL